MNLCNKRLLCTTDTHGRTRHNVTGNGLQIHHHSRRMLQIIQESIALVIKLPGAIFTLRAIDELAPDQITTILLESRHALHDQPVKRI